MSVFQTESGGVGWGWEGEYDKFILLVSPESIAKVSLAASIFTWISHAILVIVSHISLMCSIDGWKDRAVLAHVEFLLSLRIYRTRATKISPEAEDNTKRVNVADFCSSPWELHGIRMKAYLFLPSPSAWRKIKHRLFLYLFLYTLAANSSLQMSKLKKDGWSICHFLCLY